MQDADTASQIQERITSVATAEAHPMDVTVSDVFVSAALNHEGTGAMLLSVAVSCATARPFAAV